MAGIRDSATRVSLLFRVRDASDEEAWAAFVERYTPQIFAWCRRRGLQEADSADVTQIVLTKLVRSMRTFRYSPDRGSFRGWLKTVTSNAVCDLARSWEKQQASVADPVAAERLAATWDRQALDELARAIESEYEQELLSEAERRVRPRVKPHTWSAYHMTAVKQCPARDVAEQLGISVSDVYVAKSRVIKMLRGEVEAIESDAAGEI